MRATYVVNLGLFYYPYTFNFEHKLWISKSHFSPPSWESISMEPLYSLQCPVFKYSESICFSCRSQWPRGLRHELSSLSRTLRSWVRILLKVWISVLCAFILCFCCSVCR
jgi:hypothetical protein